MTHKTKGIVLRTIKYGETSIITTVYTELFGMQTYIVKGVRQSTKKAQSKANYFQPGAMLDMIVYHNELKNLQFIKEYQWSYLYQQVLFDVVKNAVAQYIAEVLLHSIKQPEANADLFYFVEETLMELDKTNETISANLPLYFTLQLAKSLGFQIQGSFNNESPVLDLQEGMFVTGIPFHPHYVTGHTADTLSQLNRVSTFLGLEKIALSRNARQELLSVLHHYMNLHVPDFAELKSLPVLQEVLR